MSRAFVKESDGTELDRDLPELRISEHRNLVTARGLELIEGEVRSLTEALASARTAGDAAGTARHARDLRYWTARRASAVTVPPPVDVAVVRFGSQVTLEHDDGRQVRYRIVGEDEASPASGSISYVSPLAAALLGRHAGDEVEVGGGTVVIADIDG